MRANPVSNVTPISGDERWIELLSRVMDEFLKVKEDITVNQIIVFLQIAKRPGVSQRDLLKATGLTDGGVARICAVLSERGHRGTPGAGVIEIGQDPHDYRVSALQITAKGRRVLASLRELMRK